MRAVLAALLLVVASAACGGSTPDQEPEAAVEAYLAAFESGDCAAARAVVLRPDDLDCTVVAESAGALAAAGLDLDQATFVAGESVDDSARVEVRWPDGDPEVVDVQRVDDAWLVVVDSAA